MTTPPTPAPAESGALRCPACGEAARLLPPSDWRMPTHIARPDASHHDGTPLCPVPGPHGSQPATPVTDPATPPADEFVYVVAGGDIIVVFDNPDIAGAQQAVMDAAGLDTYAARLTPEQWDTARTALLTEDPRITITDVRHGHDGDPA